MKKKQRFVFQKTEQGNRLIGVVSRFEKNGSVLIRELTDQDINELSPTKDKKILQSITRGRADKPLRVDAKVAMQAVSKVSQQTTLEIVACNDPDWRNRQAAVLRITNQDVLMACVRQDPKWCVRRTALKKLIIKDEEILLEIAASETCENMRKAALKRMADPSVLVKISLNERASTRTRCFAINQITDSAFLMNIAESVLDKKVSLTAVQRLRLIGTPNLHQKALLNLQTRIALNDADPEDRQSAARQISDEATLIEIAQQSRHPDVRAIAVRRMTDQQALLLIATTDECLNVVYEATKKITDPLFVAFIANNSAEYVAYGTDAWKARIKTQVQFLQSMHP